MILAALILVAGTQFIPLAADSMGIGQGFYLPDLPLIEDNGFGRTIFKTIPDECIQPITSNITRQESSYYEDVTYFYTKLGTETSLAAEIESGFTLGVSAVVASSNIGRLDIKGNSFEVYTITGFLQILPDCLASLELADDFSKSFEDLPAEIDDPSESSDWYAYNTFLKTYGSHVIKRITHGAKLTRYVFSKSSESITQDDFLIKVCATLQPLTLNQCTQYTQEDYKKVSRLSTSEFLTLRGGSEETRAELSQDFTDELLKKFLSEASMVQQPMSVQYISVWDLLKLHYMGTEHFRKAINLESYYLGYLNMGCSKDDDNGIDLRQFVLARDDPDAPQYECQLAAKGCRNDNDCHVGAAGFTCYCYGSTCVEEEDDTDPNHALKKGRYVKRVNDDSSTWYSANNSCYYTFFYCKCKQGMYAIEVVWPSNEYRIELELYEQAYQVIYDLKQDC